MNRLPLENVSIVSFAQIAQGPAAVQLLADFGADVIKVEPPGRGAWERKWSGAELFPAPVRRTGATKEDTCVSRGS